MNTQVSWADPTPTGYWEGDFENKKWVEPEATSGTIVVEGQDMFDFTTLSQHVVDGNGIILASFDAQGKQIVQPRIETNVFVNSPLMPAPEVLDAILKSNAEAAQGMGTKQDAGKARMSLLPWNALRSVAGVMTWAITTKTNPYPIHNWRRGIAYSRVFDALARHLGDWNDGESTDPESGLPHLAHAGFCVLVLLCYELMPARYRQLDDRHTYRGVEAGK